MGVENCNWERPQALFLHGVEYPYPRVKMDGAKRTDRVILTSFS